MRPTLYLLNDKNSFTYSAAPIDADWGSTVLSLASYDNTVQCGGCQQYMVEIGQKCWSCHHQN